MKFFGKKKDIEQGAGVVKRSVFSLDEQLYSLKTKENFNFFFEIVKAFKREDRNFLTSKKDALELVNKLNAEVALIKVYYSESTNTITYFYYFWTEGGFTQKSLISSLLLYKTALDLSLDKDTGKLIK